MVISVIAKDVFVTDVKRLFNIYFVVFIKSLVVLLVKEVLTSSVVIAVVTFLVVTIGVWVTTLTMLFKMDDFEILLSFFHVLRL